MSLLSAPLGGTVGRRIFRVVMTDFFTLANTQTSRVLLSRVLFGKKHNTNALLTVICLPRR